MSRGAVVMKTPSATLFESFAQIGEASQSYTIDHGRSTQAWREVMYRTLCTTLNESMTWTGLREIFRARNDLTLDVNYLVIQV